MKRDAVLQVRVTQEEKEWAEALAEEFGMKTSDYARTCILVGPTPTQEEAQEGKLPEVPLAVQEETNSDPSAFAVPAGTQREIYVQFLFERNTELHRDKHKRWPGSKARIQSGSEWAKVKAGEPLRRIEPRDPFEPIKPTTYALREPTREELDQELDQELDARAQKAVEFAQGQKQWEKERIEKLVGEGTLRVKAEQLAGREWVEQLQYGHNLLGSRHEEN